MGVSNSCCCKEDDSASAQVFIPERKDMFPGMPTSQEPGPLAVVPVLVSLEEEKMTSVAQVQKKLSAILRGGLTYRSAESPELDEKGEMAVKKIAEACVLSPTVGLRVVHEGEPEHMELAWSRARGVRAALRKEGCQNPIACRGLESLDQGAGTKIEAADASAVAAEEKEEAQITPHGSHAHTPAKGEKAKEWVILMERKTDSKLGVDVDHADNKTLYVDAVGPGIVEDYNRTNVGENEVRRGDRIIEVNGVRGDIHKMISQCKVVGTVTFVVQRDWED